MSNMIDRSAPCKRNGNRNHCFTKQDKESYNLLQKIIKEDEVSCDYKKIPEKWLKIFAIKKFAKLFFDKYKNKLIITDQQFYDFFRKKGHYIDEESSFFEILNAAKSICNVLK